MTTETPHITLPNSTPSEELYRFGADGNLRLCISTHRLPPRPNDFCKKSTRVGPKSEGIASGCFDSHKVAENKKREAGAGAVDR